MYNFSIELPQIGSKGYVLLDGVVRAVMLKKFVIYTPNDDNGNVQYLNGKGRLNTNLFFRVAGLRNELSVMTSWNIGKALFQGCTEARDNNGTKLTFYTSVDALKANDSKGKLMPTDTYMVSDIVNDYLSHYDWSYKERGMQYGYYHYLDFFRFYWDGAMAQKFPIKFTSLSCDGDGWHLNGAAPANEKLADKYAWSETFSSERDCVNANEMTVVEFCDDDNYDEVELENEERGKRVAELEETIRKAKSELDKIKNI